jgi:hypothetical protein
VGELVPAACVGNETPKVVTIGAGGCYVSTAYGKSGKGRQPDVFADGVCIMVSSTMPMALYHFLIMTLKSLRSDTSATCSSSLASVLESPQGLTRSRSFTAVSLSASS